MNHIFSYKNWVYLLLVASLFCIFTATIFPFGFVTPEGFSIKFIVEEFEFGSSIKDYWQNILLFIPLGISLFITTINKYRNIWLILVVCCLFSAVISTLVELTQLFIPTRVSNLSDIICNTIGGGVGGILYLWRKNIIQFLAGILTGNRHKLSLKSLLTAIAIYCSLVILGVGILLNSINLSNWNNDDYLAIGNEVTGDRPWHGYINNLYICDRALNQSEVIRAYEDNNYFQPQLSSLIASFTFTNRQEYYQDKSQHIPDFKSYISPQSKINKNKNKDIQNHESDQYLGILLNKNQWLKTKDSAVSLNKRLKQTNEFSFFLTVASRDLQQTGPARIISIADSTIAQNIIIGQSENNLSLRLRTPTTGNSANQPEFLVPNVFDSYGFHQILVTFAHKKLSVYIDYPKNLYSFKFDVYNSSLSYLPWSKLGWIVNLAEFDDFKYKLGFYIIVFSPLAISVYYLISKIKLSL